MKKKHEQIERSDEYVDKLIADMPDGFEIRPEALAAFRRLIARIKPIATDDFDPDKELYDALIDKYGPIDNRRAARL